MCVEVPASLRVVEGVGTTAPVGALAAVRVGAAAEYLAAGIRGAVVVAVRDACDLNRGVLDGLHRHR